MQEQMAPKQNFNKSQIVETDLKTLKALINFVYTDEVDFEKVEIEKLFVAANKFCMENLQRKCELVLVDELSVENSAELFLLSYLHGGEMLKEKSIEMIAKNFKAVRATKKWIEIEHDHTLSPAVVLIVDYMSNLF
jgi:hypothetical protein